MHTERTAAVSSGLGTVTDFKGVIRALPITKEQWILAILAYQSKVTALTIALKLVSKKWWISALATCPKSTGL